MHRFKSPDLRLIGSMIGLLVLTCCQSNVGINKNKDSNQHDPLSYGKVTSKVEKGKTTQVEVIKLFGSPNITSINNSEEEVWVYDRISTISTSQGWSNASRFDAFFGLGGYSFGGQRSGGRNERSTSTLTVIITFNKDKTIKEYSARATRF